MCNRHSAYLKTRKPAKKLKVAMYEVPLLYYFPVIVVVLVCYYNALDCGLVFDDIPAIQNNKDLRSTTPLSNLLLNDFWGTPVYKDHSHKSYRPICTLSFRFNYWLHELRPWGYHFVNIVLHVLVCLLYFRMCVLTIPAKESCIAALLFAVHPIHTEAVTGIVGRAELLSSVFFLLAFFSYIRASEYFHNKSSRFSGRIFNFLLCLFFATLAAFSKEQGITVIGVCICYDVFAILRKKRATYQVATETEQLNYRERITRILIMLSWGLILIGCRISLAKGKLPVFSRFDNPAANAENPTRILTYHYLLALNAWLLVFPCDLCCDWTMQTVPLVESVLDVHIAYTVMFYILLLVFLKSAIGDICSKHAEVLFLIIICYVTFENDQDGLVETSKGLAFLVLPFLPSSNFLFPVGFVIAERVLYIPSMGFCLLVSYGWHVMHETTFRKCKMLLWSCLTLLLCAHAMKTVFRNMDWKNEFTIFMAGLKVNQRNAKLYNNVGHVLESQGKFSEALGYFMSAVRIQPDDIGSYINLGRTYANLGMPARAEETLIEAKNLLLGTFSKTGEVRIAPDHLGVFITLANLVSRNPLRLQEADALYKQAISMRRDYSEAYVRRGDMLIQLNRTQEAQEMYEKAIFYDESRDDAYFSLGVIRLEQRKTKEALQFFNKALDLNPYHQQALLNSAIIIQDQNDPTLRKLAYKRLSNLLRVSDVNERIYFNLGMLAMGDTSHLNLAEKWFRKAIQVKKNFGSALFNLALLLFNSGRTLEALPLLLQLIQENPDHIKAYFLLGDIYTNHFKDLNSAEWCYRKILEYDSKNIQAVHNLCVVHAERGHLLDAEECFVKALILDPHEDIIRTHLQIIHTKRNFLNHDSLSLLENQKICGPNHLGNSTARSPKNSSVLFFHSHEEFVSSDGLKKAYLKQKCLYPSR